MPYGGLGIARYEAHTGLTVTASAAVAINQAVKVSGDMTVAPANAGDVVIGIVTKAAAANEKATIRLKGDVFNMTAAAAVVAGAVLVANGGNVQTHAAEASESIVGVALKAAAANAQTPVVVF